MKAIVTVELPASLCRLAHAPQRLALTLEGPVTQSSILDVLEEMFPTLEGCLRDHTTRKRRPFIRFFGCEEDFSNFAPDEPLPAEIAEGQEPFLIIGAIAGG